MPNVNHQLRATLPAALHAAVELVLKIFAYYLIPVGIGVVSLIALVFWHDEYRTSGDVPLAMHVTVDRAAALAPGDALALARATPLINSHDTHLSEAPVWFVFEPMPRAGEQVIEFPSRHALDIGCWNANTLEPLGAATRSTDDGALRADKAGFAMRLAPLPRQLLCRATFSGPARLSVLQWPADQFALSVKQYHRKSGLLDGGMIVLALFIIITALINRQPVYVLFAGWLILNLRVGALSAGWDIQWLGQTVPSEWLLRSRAVTITLYGIATLTLYQALLKEHLAEMRYLLPMRVMQWLCMPMLAAAMLLPYGMYLPLLWGILVCCFSLMTVGLFKIIVESRTRVAAWFAASFAVTFLASLAEVLSAALGMRELLGVINSVTAALASSLLAALAVAEQMRMETEKRQEAQEELEHAYQAMPVGLFTLDMYGHFLSVNPALQKMLGMSGFAPGRTAWRQFFTEASWANLHEQVHAKSEAEMELASRDGNQRFLVSATLARSRIEGVLQDTTEKHKATEQLRFMANNDPLTKVYNRRGIEREFSGAAASLAAGRPMALAYVDLDRFKLINDLFGHAAGDEVLKQVCERMGTMLAGGQQIGRVGGDEFVIVMPETAIPLASIICRGIVDRLGNTPYRVGDKAFHVRASVGLIEVVPGMPMKDAVSTSDRACREAKTGLGDGLVVYERGADAFRQRAAELDLVERLSGPDATDNLLLEMQPIMSLRAPHESMNFEVLLRMREADGRVVPAGAVIAAAEKSGRASMIDRWVLTTTLAWIAEHTEDLVNTRFVCMNLSGASLNDERFVQDTFDILGRYVHVASRLCLEITESVALHDLDNTRRFIDQVRSFGVKVALDDFGAGYTSFSYLKELPADVLKIDGNFIVNINAHPANVAIVEAIVSLAVNLGMKTIAEWAEDAATVQTLHEIGVDYVQGYVVARSMPPERLLEGRSSAGFIRDEDLLELLRELENPPAPHLASVSRLH
ncbi:MULTISPECIES: bifunctional diguanylate cyclase/phosphodiesterase [Massilia]|uniref:putative bifunctional diguanylate cyclase/phosphodiesterase n=1 Tax=Massilia TaxID=149698 RepID=UPI001C62BF9F|nr:MULTISPECIES: EAL domain-containing protein [Massilia]QYG03579.1 EAL domain-containing protein [Massilia sp. NP310]